MMGWMREFNKDSNFHIYTHNTHMWGFESIEFSVHMPNLEVPTWVLKVCWPDDECMPQWVLNANFIRRMTMYQQVNALIFLTHAQKGRFDKNSSSTILLSSLRLNCLPFLLNVSEMWLANPLTTCFTKIMSNLIFTCSM